MATCRLRGDKFEFIVKRKGLLPKPIYLTFDLKADGEAYCSHLEGLLDQGIIPEEFLQNENDGLTVRKVMIEYELTVPITQNDKNLLGVNRERIGDLRISEVTYDWAERFVLGMKRKRNLVPGTIRHHIGALARCFDWAVKKGYMPFNPLRIFPKGYATYTEEDKKYVELKEDQERDRRLEPGEEEMIRKVLMTEHKPAHKQRPLELEHRLALMLMFEMAIETAMRMREIYTLSKNQIDINKRTIFLVKTKNGDRRQVPLSSIAISALKLYFKEVPKRERGTGDLLFPFWNGSQNSKELTATTSKLSRKWKRIFEHAGCESMGFHDLRHEATSRFYERTTLSDLQIAKITGHKNLEMLRRYANLRASDLAGQLW